MAIDRPRRSANPVVVYNAGLTPGVSQQRSNKKQKPDSCYNSSPGLAVVSAFDSSNKNSWYYGKRIQKFFASASSSSTSKSGADEMKANLEPKLGSVPLKGN